MLLGKQIYRFIFIYRLDGVTVLGTNFLQNVSGYTAINP